MKRKSTVWLGIGILLIASISCRLLPPSASANATLESAQTELAAQARTRLASVVVSTERSEPGSATPEANPPGEPGSTPTGQPLITITGTLPARLQTSTRALPQTPTPTSTRTATPTKKVAETTGWDGEWTAYFGQAGGMYQSGALIITLNGTDLTATATLGGVAYNFEGYTFNDGDDATGSWSSQSASGNFWWTLLPSSAFGGSWDNQYGFCGARAGNKLPDPCLILPPM